MCSSDSEAHPERMVSSTTLGSCFTIFSVSFHSRTHIPIGHGDDICATRRFVLTLWEFEIGEIESI